MPKAKYDEYLKPKRRGPGDAAVVFIHGFCGNIASTWGQFPAYLRGDPRLRSWDVFSLGYDTTLFPDIRGLWSANASLSSLAQLLQTAILSPPLGGENGYEAIVLVAHSMGGLIAQSALLDEDVADRVDQVFLFGTPSGGLWKAWLGKVYKRQFRDMAPDSEFMIDLRKRWGELYGRKTPFKFWVVAGENDEFVPTAASQGPFSSLPARNLLRVPGNHTQMVKPTSPDSLGVQLVTDALVGQAGRTETWNAALVATQRRAFEATAKRLWPRRMEIDQDALVELALALEELGRQSDAVATLEKYGTSTDAMGTLAGRLKRRWLATRVEADARAALDLYTKALEQSEAASAWSQAFYHAINVAFLQLAYANDQALAETYAQRTLDACGKHIAGKREKRADVMWRLAAEGEANLVLGNADVALEKYAAAIGEKPDPRQVTSMFAQAMEVAGRIGTKKTVTRLVALFKGAEGAIE